MLNADAAFAAAVLALYAADSIVLVERGQAVLERRRSGWRMALGTRHYLVRGRPLVVLDPFAPAVPALRTAPLLGERGRGLAPPRAAAGLRWAGALAAAQFLLVIVAIPLSMLRFPGWPLVIAIALAYANALAIAALLAMRFRALGVPLAALRGAAFNAAVCLPLSVNLLRRACLALPIGVDARRAVRLVRPADRDAARRALLVQLDEAMQDAEEGTAQLDALRRVHAQVAGAR